FQSPRLSRYGPRQGQREAPLDCLATGLARGSARLPSIVSLRASPGAARGYCRRQLLANAAGFLAFLSIILRICELAHTSSAKTMSPYGQAQCDIEGMEMLAWIMAVVVGIGLIWSVATMTNLVPLIASDSAAIAARG